MTQIGTSHRTRRILAALVAALSLLPLSACFDFPVPLDPGPALKLDPQLLGPWSCLPMEAPLSADLQPSSDVRLITLSFVGSGSWYRITMVGLDKPGERQVWSGYPSRLEKKTVLNVWPVAEPPPPVGKEVTLVVQTWLSPNVFQLDLIDNDPVKGQALSPSAALRKTLLSHRPQGELFSPFLVCARAKVVDPS